MASNEFETDEWGNLPLISPEDNPFLDEDWKSLPNTGAGLFGDEWSNLPALVSRPGSSLPAKTVRVTAAVNLAKIKAEAANAEGTDEQIRQEERKPKTWYESIFDAIDRLRYGGAKFFDASAFDTKRSLVAALGSLAEKTSAGQSPLPAIGEILKGPIQQGLAEVIYPTERLSFKDEFAKGLRQSLGPNAANSPAGVTASTVVGEAFDALWSPLTYAGIGPEGTEITSVLKPGIKATLSAEGKSALGSVMKNLGDQLARGYNAKQLGKLADAYQALEQPAKDAISEFAPKIGGLLENYQQFASKLPATSVKGFFDTAKGEISLPGALTAMKMAHLPEITEFTPFKAASEKVIEMIEAGNTALRHPGGLSFVGKTIVPGSVFRALSDASGLTAVSKSLGEAISGTKFYNMLGKAFSAPGKWNWPAEAVESLKSHFASESRLKGDVAREAGKIASDFKEPELLSVGAFGHDVRDATGKEYLQMLASGMGEKEAMQAMSERAPEIIQETLASTKAKLGTTFKKEFDLYSRLSDLYGNMAKEERAAGLLKSTWFNYWPAVYDVTKDPKTYELLAKSRIPNKFLPAAQERFFDTIEQARQAGLDPEMNAIMLYANRLVEARTAVEHKVWLDSMYHLYGKDGKLPISMAEDIRYIGNQDYGDMNRPGKYALQFFDRLNNVYRHYATSIKPYFAVKQAISNSLQIIATMGSRAVGSFDPRAMRDASLLLAHHHGMLDPEWQITKDFLRRGIRSSIGEDVSYGQMYEELLRNETIRGTTVSSLQRSEGTMKDEIEKWSRLYGGQPDFMRRLLVGSVKYWQWASHVEDFARVTNFVNARRLGYTEQAARDVTERALFDYAHGLSLIERRIFRRAMPLVAYQRLAFPLIADTLFKHPGRIINIGRGIRAFWDSYNAWAGGEELSPTDRVIADGTYLWDKHFLYFDKYRKAVFGTLNSVNPFDTLTAMDYDEDGNINIPRTVTNAIWDQVGWGIKMPLDLVQYGLTKAGAPPFFSRDMYLRLSPRGETEPVKIGEVDPKVLLNNIASVLVARKAGFAGIALGAFGVQHPEQIPDGELVQFFKSISGWEEHKNPETKRMETYVNPWLMWATAHNLPVVRDVINYSKTTDSPREKFYRMMGISLSKTDIRKMARGQKFTEDTIRADWRKRIMILEASYKQLQKEPGVSADELERADWKLQKAKTDFQDYLKFLMEKYQNFNAKELSGEGTLPTDESAPQ